MLQTAVIQLNAGAIYLVSRMGMDHLRIEPGNLSQKFNANKDNPYRYILSLATNKQRLSHWWT